MKLSTSFLASLAGTALSTPLNPPSSSSSPPLDPSHLFLNPDPFSSAASAARIPTSRESAVLGRRVLALSSQATLSTVFPTSYSAPAEDADGLPRSVLLEHRPPGLGGVPVGLMDYIADCDARGRGDPTILAIRIATSFKNVEAGSNLSVAVNWVPPYPPRERIELFERLRGWGWSPWSWWPSSSSSAGGGGEQQSRYDVGYSAANLPRFSLLGYLEPIAAGSDADADALRSCFLKYHPDARYWLPGNRIHESEWVRLVVTQVYWVGGFGDRAYIGWIPAEEWRNVTREEWEGVRLPGEKKGWREWMVGGEGEL